MSAASTGVPSSRPLLVLPTYNEIDSLPDVLTRLLALESALHILVVDDEQSIRGPVSLCLEAFGHRLTEAGSAEAVVCRPGDTASSVAYTELRRHSSPPSRPTSIQQRSAWPHRPKINDRIRSPRLK